ncbi:MAG: DNA polymerase III subunit alpha [Patescibacteria group bacterium]|nr:DNA polymerase III subunit alpha [Patescibacteria group bacterium]
MPGRFTHLHVHSHYSLLQALPKIPDLVAAAKAAGCKSLALTDRDNLYGAIEFYKECEHAGLKAIIGLDATLQSGENKHRLVLLAQNETGYRNLLALVTESHLSDSPSPVVSRELLKKYAEGLISIIPSLGGEITSILRSNENKRIKKVVDEYRSIFGDDNVYLEVSVHPEIDGHDAAMETLRESAIREHIPLVAGQEIFYLSPDDRRAWTVMRAIENRGPSEEGDIGGNEEDFSLQSAEQMEKLFADIPEALENASVIAERCSLEFDLGSWVFPAFPLSGGSSYEKELHSLIERGFSLRGMEPTLEMRKRVDYEFSIIAEKGFAPYFLVVADLLSFAREHGILTTTRGSAAGSLISYLTFITNVNPITYQLPFERFLNPERPKAPDIDMDFADTRRDEVIEYARKKYGETHVAQIGTFGTMLARGVVRDVARALGYAYGLGDRIAKEVPFGSQGFPMTLERALKENPELAKMYKEEEETREIIDLGRKIEGCARHISVHAAGVVIAPETLVHYTPLQKDPKGGKIITQYDMYSVEDVGLLKFDFLGIRNLSILASSVKLVEKTRGIKIDIENVPLNDRKTFEMLANGETEGTFQLNGSGMTRFLKELRPTTIHDINAMVALFRPGPMEMIPAYIERKHNPALITYLDPRMEDILERSYGVITYQDDVLLIAVRLAGYSWLEADALRKAMGKKIPAEMEAQKEKLIAGAIQNGMGKQRAERLWKLIEPFAAYGFNKAHAASYGKVAYQTAYMKANYPIEYMAAILTAEAGDVDTTGIMVTECKRMGIPVLPPDINESFGDFTVVLGASEEKTEKAARLASGTNRDAIRFGLYSIKNFGQGVAGAIITERKLHGRFVSLSDFLRRVQEQALNKKALEALIQCGALDSFGERGNLLANIERILEYHRSAGESSQQSLFAGLGEINDLALFPSPPAPLEEKLQWEKELLGLYVSGHPLERVREKLAKRSMTIEELREKLQPGMSAVTGGIIEEMRTVLTKAGDQMAFIKIADFNGSIEAVVFPKSFTEYRALLKPDSCIALKGRLSNRNGELSLVAEALKAL